MNQTMLKQIQCLSLVIALVLISALELIFLGPFYVASAPRLPVSQDGSADSSLVGETLTVFPRIGLAPEGMIPDMQSADEDVVVYLPLIFRHGPLALVKPKDLLVYYAWPSCINGTWNVNSAAAEFGQYGYVVLGDCLEFDGTRPGGLCNASDPEAPYKHPDHDNTKLIIAHPATADTGFFGYIDLGVTTQNLSLTEIGARIRLWQAMGVRGIFFDDFGYDFQTPRQRQNHVISYTHSLGMVVVANGFVPDEVLGDQIHPIYNPSGIPTELNSRDYYFYESYQIKVGNYVSENEWQQKASALDLYRRTMGIQVMANTTNNVANEYDGNKFFYAWYSALLDGYEAGGWGEYEYAANTCQAPFRNRPLVNPGTVYVSEVIHNSPIHLRNTDLGRIWVDTSVPDAGFEPD